MTSISKRLIFVFLLFCLLLFLCVAVSAQDGFDVERIQRATVFIMQTQSVGDNLVITCVGSGTIVSRDGLILTNAHNTVPNANCPGETIIIALNVRPGEPPIASYQADTVQSDPGLDLALLRISRQIDGQLVERSSLALPFVELGNSDAVELDETITVVGYPGIGDDPIVLERGTISGFAAEPSGGDRSWLKTSANIRATMSGGGAFNQNGELIGVPTTAPLSSDSPAATCANVQDSNDDGLINDDDICISIGGFINLLRPSSFARPLLRAAQLNLQVEVPSQGQTPTTLLPVADPPRFRYLGFAPSVNEAGMPTTIIRSLPAGSDSLYLFFDYENMTAETVYELRVNTNGIPNPNFSLSPVRWSGGQRGLWYVGSSGQPFPNGTYDFTLFINGIAEGNARLIVGESSDTSPQFGDIVFGLLDLDGNVTGTGFVLPTGTTANARFLYRNMTPGLPWAAIWYYEGAEVQRTPADTVWLEADGANGNKTISVQDQTGLPPGSYRLELYVEGRLSAVSDFTLAGGQDGNFARIFTNTRFTTAGSFQEAQSAAPINTFSAGITTIYALFDWQLIASGTLWRVDWSVDGELFYSQTQPWTGAQTGENFAMRLSSPGGLPDGSYQIDLFIGALPFDTAEARVGIGQLPIDQFADPEGIVMRGRVIDAVSREGIAGVSVLLVSEDFSVSEFTAAWVQSQLFATATTDRNGNFQIDRPLAREAPYSILFLADGYLPVTADGVEITDETHPDDAPIEYVVELTPE
jgi:S1-C subfamily serine protease